MAKPGFDPSDAVEFWDLVNRQDWAICESVQRGMSSRVFQTGYYAPMESWSLDIRRYIGERLGGRRGRRRREAGVRRITSTSSSGSAAGAAPRPTGSPAGPVPTCSGSSSSSWATCAASRRTTRGSSGSPTTRPATSSWPSTRTAPGPRSSATRASSSCSRPAGSTSRPRESAIPLTNYSGSMDAAGVPYEHLDAAEIMPALAAVRRDRRHPRPVPARQRHRDGGPGQRGARADGAGARRDAARPRAGRADPVRRAARSRSRPAASAYRCRRLVIAAGAWSNGALAHVRHAPAAPGHQGAGHLLRHAARGGVPARPVPGLDLDGRPVLLRVSRSSARPGPKAGQDAGGQEVTADTRTLRAGPGGAASGRWTSSASTSRRRWARSSTPRPASTPSRPTATS